MGYHRAGFEVVGVDINNQPHYPMPFEFIQADAITFPLDGFDAIHASPPCQDHMKVGNHPVHGTGWMLDHTRQRLLKQAAPWIIENVPGAEMRRDFTLCGCQFDLELRRQRWFEVSWEVPFVMQHPCHHNGPVVSVVGHGTPSWVRKKWSVIHGRDPRKADYQAAMGIDWMSRDELSQAIPPAYTEYIGSQLLQHLAPVGTQE